VTGRRPVVQLRRATDADADLLLAWSNDPATRAASFHPEPIERADHVRWLATRLASPSTGLWIGEAGGQPIGQVRVEIVAHEVGEISISTAANARRVGLGRALLDAAIAEAGEALPISALLARVRLDNPASLALFSGAGFVERGRTTCAGVPCAEFELRLG
jgi:RimJ/RimL family protein N-acetyltransferase